MHLFELKILCNNTKVYYTRKDMFISYWILVDQYITKCSVLCSLCISEWTVDGLFEAGTTKIST